MTDADPGVALVTGAARGIGAATVLALARSGWRVLAVDVCADDAALPYPLGTRDELDAVVKEAGDPASVLSYVCDVRDEDALGQAVDLAERTWGGLDADVDLGGVISLARVAIPALLRRPQPRSGRFLAVASAAATRGMPGLAAYSAAKAGVAGLVRGLAVDLRGTGVTANAVSPGSTATAILDESARLYGLGSAQEFAWQQPLERLLEPAEIAAALAWLAGPEASGLTGAVVPVDAGLAL